MPICTWTFFESPLCSRVKRPLLLLLSLFCSLELARPLMAQNAYISNYDDSTVSVVDTSKNQVIAKIPVGNTPDGVAAALSGTFVYVSNTGDNTVSVINTRTHAVIATIHVGQFPTGLALTPDGTKLYVANGDMTISVINTKTNTVTSSIAVANNTPCGVAITADGSRAYVTSQNYGNNSGAVYVIDTSSDTLIGNPIPISPCPIEIASSPDGKSIYVTGFGVTCGDNLGELYVIDTQSNAVTGPFPVGGNPIGVAVTPDGTTIYVANDDDNTVSAISAATDTVIATIPVGIEPYGLSVTPDGTKVYVTNNNDYKKSGSVSVIDTASNSVVATIVVGGAPHALGSSIGPALNPINRSQQQPPVQLGTSGSNVADCCTTGTLGALVKDAAGNTYILSNNHVLARTNQGHAGEQIIQRGFGDTIPACSTNGTVVVAQLSTFVPLDFTGKANTVDAAIAQTFPNQVNTNGSILGIGAVSTATAAPSVGLSVMKAGRTTGLTSGEIEAVGMTLQVPYKPCGQAAGVAKFVNLFVVGPGSFWAVGDSGSLIVKKVPTGPPNPVGLSFATDTKRGLTYASPINTVLTALNVSFVGNAPTDLELKNAEPIPVDHGMEAALQVKARHDDFLLSLPAVVGHAVGFSRSGTGTVVIRVYVTKQTPVLLRRVPASLEGVPIEVEEVGEIRTN